jgi:putative DNA primase/helicase
VWAALSTCGLLRLDLPQSMRDVIVLADGDERGKAAARGATLRWKREGRHVRIAFASEGMDFNDMLLGRAPINKEGA